MTYTPTLKFDPGDLSLPELPQLPRRRTHLKSFKTYGALGLAAIQIGCNVALLYATIHTYRFGARVVKEGWRIKDEDLISFVEFISKMLTAMSAVIGGWATTQIWARKLYNPRNEAGLAELQSLDIFRSITVIPQAFLHVYSNDYTSGRTFYAILVAVAILLQFYSTSIVTLATPTLSWVSHSPTTYSYDALGFMTNFGYGNRCMFNSNGTERTGKERDSCLSIMLAENSLRDVETYDENALVGNVQDYPFPWSPTLTSYDSNRFIVGRMWLGPQDNVTLSSGTILYGLNIATIERIIGLPDGNATSNPWDSIVTTIRVDTSIPFLTSRCTQTNAPNISSIAIQSLTYNLPKPIPPLTSNEAVGQVASDNTTLMLSFGTTLNETTNHCAINLGFKNTTISVQTGVAQYGLLQPGSPSVFFSDQVIPPWTLEPVASPDPQYSTLMSAFSSVWLSGVGWNDIPSQSALASFFSNKVVATGHSGNISAQDALETYTLVMLGNGISAGFAQEHAPLEGSAGDFSTRIYTIEKREFYIGERSLIRYFWMFIITFDSVFVLCCLGVIMRWGWLPDWTDPSVVLSVALSSQPPSVPAIRMTSRGQLRLEPDTWQTTFTVRTEDVDSGYLCIVQASSTVYEEEEVDRKSLSEATLL
ncbi:hypothetical protein NLI96_g2219 [Meripilus lineatus]|uniref:Uncharacterized protein n=1 Tax=Meripilus lineatus TaxID=2056292 RepID=A0AAD5V951_9APHY|nr:hypothetical protein NLI96_g2219 [Physisporinus lineatus]